jgi:hypothetical protein
MIKGWEERTRGKGKKKKGKGKRTPKGREGRRLSYLFAEEGKNGEFRGLRGKSHGE